jgi:hypothetical protein
MFTDRFIKVPIILFDVKEHDLLDKEPWECDAITVMRRIDPERVQDYYACIPAGQQFEEDNLTVTEISMANGETFVIRMPIKEFETLLNGIEE